MTSRDPTLSDFSQEWAAYQAHIVKALTPLSAEQLALRAAPHLRSIREIATHMVAVRARWMHLFLGEGGEEHAEIGTWDREGPDRTAAELVSGFGRTWELIWETLPRWSEADLSHVVTRTRGEETLGLSRRWVIWHMIEHDLHHGGELSFSLGMHGLEAPDI